MTATERLRKWAERTSPYDRMTWVGKNYALSDAKADVRALLSEPHSDLHSDLEPGESERSRADYENAVSEGKREAIAKAIYEAWYSPMTWERNTTEQSRAAGFTAADAVLAALREISPPAKGHARSTEPTTCPHGVPLSGGCLACPVPEGQPGCTSQDDPGLLEVLRGPHPDPTEMPIPRNER